MAKETLQLKTDNNEIKVSVLCTTYNHEHCLRKCLDSFLAQKTNFKFEVIVHDDASTDNTQDIVREYAEKYPNIIVPIHQKENQDSKDVAILDGIMFPMSKGKYIAICEGDDYWCDELKLQRQFDFMEKNPDFIGCFHNTIKHDLLCKQKDKKFNHWHKKHVLTAKDVFGGYRVHTSSYFVRREHYLKPEYGRKYWFGDIVRLTYWFSLGKLMCLPYVMSVYNVNNFSSVTTGYKKQGLEYLANKLLLELQYLDEYNAATKYKFSYFVNQRKKMRSFTAFFTIYEDKLKKCQSAKEYHFVLKEIKTSTAYKEGFKSYKTYSGLMFRIRWFIKNIIPFWLYKFIINRKHNGKS